MQVGRQLSAKSNLSPKVAAEAEAWLAEQDRFPKDRLLEFGNGRGRRMLARVLLPGDHYGRMGCLTWGERAGSGVADPATRAAIHQEYSGKPGIEFFDLTHKGELDRWGQFTGGRYYLGESILGGREGLTLDGGIPEWAIDAEPMNAIREWAKAVLAKESIGGSEDGAARSPEAKPTGLRGATDVHPRKNPLGAIRGVFSALYKEETTEESAEKRLAELGPEVLAEFIVDAFNRGWISRFNLGLDEDGNII